MSYKWYASSNEIDNGNALLGRTVVDDALLNLHFRKTLRARRCAPMRTSFAYERYLLKPLELKTLGGCAKMLTANRSLLA